MKKNTIAIILLLASLNSAVFAQSGADEPKSYVGDINKMFASAPTSNNLMKFEEVPVSYYTGIPDISIPLVSIPTGNSKVAVGVQLKYHPLNAKPDDRAGETGLGWSLIAGGTISRTVRGGNPDEKNRTIAFSTPPKAKYGIYNEIYNPTPKLMKDQTIDLDEYSFQAAMGRYDTEYDLYQYNFMGQSGRFYIVKDDNGNYKPEKLDKNNLQIIINNIAPNEITSFTIVDDKGIRYTFEAMEKSQKNLNNVKIGIISGIGNPNPSLDFGNYWAAFHLIKIEDQNNILLANFNYAITSKVKFEETPTTTKRFASNVQYTNSTGNPQIPDGSMPGAFETQYTYNDTNTKLLTSIEVIDKGTIYLNYEKGRQDSNYTEPAELYKLKSVQSSSIGQNAQQFTDKYILDYGYSNTNFQPENGAMKTLQKMILTKVTKTAPNVQNQEYNLDYYLAGTGILQKDKWGYYTGPSLAYRADVLKSLTYPTKGKAVFDFGPNDYSHYYNGAGMAPIQGHSEIQNNDFSVNFGHFSNTDKKYFFTVNTAQNVPLHLGLGNLVNFKWDFKIYKKNTDNTFSPFVYRKQMGNQTCNKTQPPACQVSNPDPNGEIHYDYYENIYFEPGEYYASLAGSYPPSNPDDTYDLFEATTTETVFIDEKIRYGGGLRINRITYYENPTSSVASKTYAYNYKNINDTQRSSGALVFPEPITRYNDGYTYRNKRNNETITYSAQFEVITDYNIIPAEKTQGSDVGYKYVTVEQLDKDNNSKGKTVHTFRSPLDYPNVGSLSTVVPVIPIPNLDYLRGQQISEKTYNSAGQILSETNTDYITTEFEKNDGIKIFDNYEKNMVSEYYGFNNYQSLFNHFQIGITLTIPYKSFGKFGVTLPTEKRETSYFYKNGVQSSVSSTTNTAYNTEDYPINVTQSVQGGDTYVSGYKYAKEKANQRLIAANMLAIPLETESKKNGQTLSKTETKYDNVANLFPSSVISSDLQNSTPYTEVTYEKYDVKGNLQQYKTKDGTSVSIVWGYNNTQPIAKIEGITYDALVQAAGSQLSAAIAASDTDASAVAGGNEDALLSKLNDLRVAINGFGPITTYTYDPLIGVRSITQPLEVQELYLYDSANRLKEIKQKEVSATNVVSYKTVKEFEYHYKN
ncbi:hypothetical protein [Chryseobacterium polytrichastri]|uniref:YD repeat-containing protein n=1 Tax=Chryseobacterium polytrichastri TaxID=1302687 RepID=A0A1M6UI29_9FLAO|nr:hypothetical protein [Chryseobacterium polytrichastri]SHK68827.1 hypothetical protein SAMN05444267_1006174 [Chryseobacterium polytrichastri]